MSKKNKTVAILLGFIPMIIVMAVIFLFSAMPGDESGEASGGIIKAFIRLFGKDSASVSDRLFRLLNLIIRKIAHFTEYGVLGACSVFCVAGFKAGERLKNVSESRVTFFVGWGIAILYAITDEIHQYFVLGRYGTWTDVLIDSAGAITGILIFRAIVKKHLRRKQGTDSGEPEVKTRTNV